MSTSVVSAHHALPDGFRVRLRDDVVRADRDRVLVGGSPARVVRLSSLARTLLADDILTVDGPATARLARRLLDANLAEPILAGVEIAPEQLTVVVPVRDRAEQLGRCLAALVPLRLDVVDDASADPDRVAEVARRHGARVLSLATNRGPAGARNAGLRVVDSPLVAFVDSDVTVAAASLLDLARHTTDPAVALIGPRVVGLARGSRRARPRWFERYDAVASSLDLGRVGGVVRPGAAVGWLPSACLVGRTETLRGTVGGFEGSWRVAEDVDLVWRLSDEGHVARYEPRVTALHDVRPSVRSWLGRKFVYGTGGADLAARHGDKVAPAVLSLPMAVAAAAVLQRRWWSLPAAAAATALVARSIAPRLPLDDRLGLATRLAARGLVWAVRQESALLLRHWWPAAAVAGISSRSVRRALMTAAVVDYAVLVRERERVDLPTALVARRADDLAYGAGLWWGAVRRRDPRCLLPRWTGSVTVSAAARRAQRAARARQPGDGAG